MDRHKWMYEIGHAEEEYVTGVQSFLKFADTNRLNNGDLTICFPCADCKNLLKYSDTSTIERHLITRGFVRKYTCWSRHGELHVDGGTSIPVSSSTSVSISNENVHKLVSMVNENENNNSRISGDFTNKAEMFNNMEGTIGDNDEEKLQQLFEDLENRSMLEAFHEMLPEDNGLPVSLYQDKKMMCPMGLEIERIDACPNDCILYRKEYKDLHSCVICNESRYKKKKGTNVSVNAENNGPPAKLLRYLPIIPRLKRLFANEKDATLLRWHFEKLKKDGKLRHVADSPQWRKINNKFEKFSSDIRNICFGLSSDGINPFGTMSSQHSPKQPGNDIDVYLAPLIDDMKTLWGDGVDVYDAYKKETFKLRAMIFCTISDFLAYGNLSGYITKGKFAYPVCEDQTCSRWLMICKKTVFMGHRRSLESNHPYRKMKKEFDGRVEYGKLAPEEKGSRTYLPPACYTMSKVEKTQFCQCLHDIKVPSGYYTNIKKLVSMQDCKLIGMSKCNPTKWPMDLKLQLTKDEGGKEVDPTKYRSIIESLRYLLNTHPDLSYSVGVVSKYMQSPKESHYAAMKKILRYLKGTTEYGLKYPKGGNGRICRYSDSSHASDIEDRRSTTGMVFYYS
nr:hypothetical protein [Tanacetum cinerariifolium]